MTLRFRSLELKIAINLQIYDAKPNNIEEASAASLQGSALSPPFSQFYE